MRKNYLLFIIIAFPFLLMSCITPGIKETNPVGKVYRDSIQLWGRNIPLPEGEWKVIGRGGFSNNLEDEMFFDIMLLKESKTKTVHTFLLISTESMKNLSIGYQSEKFLKDVHHIVVKNNVTGGGHDSWLINHSLLSDLHPENLPALREAFDYLRSNQITMPNIMIRTVHHFTGKYQKNKYLDVVYLLNPEIEGFESLNETNWGTSEWHPLRIDNDPQKKAYIERLKEEGAIMHEKIRVGFGD